MKRWGEKGSLGGWDTVVREGPKEDHKKGLC